MRLTIERLGHRGDGVARAPEGDVGEQIHVPGTLPGEVVEGEVVAGRMPHPRILVASPARVRPPCPHAATCGACPLQHASDAFVARWKREAVIRALAQRGLTPMVDPHVATSPPASRRRATLAGRRTRKGALVGFRARASDQIVAVPGCLVLHPEIKAAFPALEALVTAGASRKGTLALHVTRSMDGIDVAVTGGKLLDRALATVLAGIAARASLARLVWDGDLVVERTPPRIRMGDALVSLPPAAFLQATHEGEATLVAAVDEALAGAARILDLFSGLGTFALPLARRAVVHAVDGDAALIAALARAGATTHGLRGIETQVRDLFRRPLDEKELADADGVVIDPPRAGAAAQVAHLARAPVPVIAMVSCNPATFARDAATLVQGGYRIDWLRVIDQFRWSAEIELVARFSRVAPG